MDRFRRSILTQSIAVIVVALSGCAGDTGPVVSPRLPQVLAGPPPQPKAAVFARDVLATAVERAERDDLTGAVRALDALPPAERDGTVRELSGALAQHDPWRAGRFALALPAGSLQAVATEIAVPAMLARDPDATVQWAIASTSPTVAFAARNTVAIHLTERDPPAALERLQALPASTGRDQMLGFGAAAWARRDQAAALAWAHELPAGEFKIHMATSVGFAVAQTEPERAVAIAELLPEGRDRRLLFSAIGQTWVARNEAAAWAWAGKLAEGPTREAAFAGIEAGLGVSTRGASRSAPASGIIRRSSRFAPLSPGEASSLPFGLERDEALRNEFDEALRESPVRAANWLAMLPLPDRHAEMTDELARQWLKVDPRAAENWMEQNVLLRSHREELLRETGR